MEALADLANVSKVGSDLRKLKTAVEDLLKEVKQACDNAPAEKQMAALVKFGREKVLVLNVDVGAVYTHHDRHKRGCTETELKAIQNSLDDLKRRLAATKREFNRLKK